MNLFLKLWKVDHTQSEAWVDNLRFQ
jgi:hypothetical protein